QRTPVPGSSQALGDCRLAAAAIVSRDNVTSHRTSAAARGRACRPTTTARDSAKVPAARGKSSGFLTFDTLSVAPAGVTYRDSLKRFLAAAGVDPLVESAEALPQDILELFFPGYLRADTGGADT